MKQINLISTLLIGVLVAFLMGATIANAFNRPDLAFTVGVVLTVAALIPKTKGSVAYESASPDLSAISRYAFNNKITLLRRYYNSMAIASDITFQPNVKNAMPMPMLVINGQPRPYTGNHKANPKDIGYTDRELTVEQFQRDFIVDPSQYRNTYLANYRGPGEGANNMTIPFAQFTLETAVGDNGAKLNNLTAFNGLGKAAFSAFDATKAYAVKAAVKFAGADGEPHYYVAKAATVAGESPLTAPQKWTLSDALAICEGLGTKLRAGRSAGLIRTTSTGIITAEDAFEQALAVYRNLDDEVKDSATDIFLYASSNVVDKISDSFKNDIKKYTDADGKLVVLPRTDGVCKIKKATWMKGSNTMFASPKSNLFMGTDRLSDFNDLRTIEQVYNLEMGLKGLIGFQYADEQAISINDQN
ncbi:hypothetical protein [Pedobacter antarcticus]|uniref:hypothetical protein n=1 Tax=Pedobacter antarcticus TaxID=34086 RepID=UPI002930CF67|nr:hypothetical protein [Pedobacter antarcticus]